MVYVWSNKNILYTITNWIFFWLIWISGIWIEINLGGEIWNISVDSRGLG